MTLWQEIGPEHDVVLTSRVRLARNYPDLPFPSRANIEQSKEVISRTLQAFKETGDNLRYLELVSLDELTQRQLVEHHVISFDLMRNAAQAAVLLSQDETVSIMMNEEDDLRIQALLPGLQLEAAAQKALELAKQVERAQPLSYDKRLGYLTCCPTNLGTAMRASVMVRLPGLTLSGRIKGVLDSVAKMGLTVRGLYGEGSEAIGSIYQISNQVTLGVSEEDILQSVQSVAAQVIDAERQARAALTQSRKVELEDRLLRSYGILSQARLLSSKEFMERLSDVWLAQDLGYLPNLPPQSLLQVMIEAQPASIQRQAGHNLSDGERDERRAQLVRKTLLEKTIPQGGNET